jgi:hypothetical protein
MSPLGQKLKQGDHARISPSVTKRQLERAKQLINSKGVLRRKSQATANYRRGLSGLGMPVVPNHSLDVRYWHLADMLNALTNVRFWE